MIAYRVANAFDLPIFVSLDKELFPYAPWTNGQYKEEFSSPTRHFVVALDEELSIIGYAGVFAPGATEADILTVGVVPGHRGKGIAKALMALITDWASAQGSTAMMLEVKAPLAPTFTFAVIVADSSFVLISLAWSISRTSRAERARRMLWICFSPPSDHAIAFPRGKRKLRAKPSLTVTTSPAAPRPATSRVRISFIKYSPLLR